jgi:hypothetical protein
MGNNKKTPTKYIKINPNLYDKLDFNTLRELKQLAKNFSLQYIKDQVYSMTLVSDKENYDTEVKTIMMGRCHIIGNMFGSIGLSITSLDKKQTYETKQIIAVETYNNKIYVETINHVYVLS